MRVLGTRSAGRGGGGGGGGGQRRQQVVTCWSVFVEAEALFASESRGGGRGDNDDNKWLRVGRWRRSLQANREEEGGGGQRRQQVVTRVRPLPRPPRPVGSALW